MLINMINDLLWHEISPKLLGQEISSCDKKFLLVARNFFLWQDISSLGKYLFVTLFLHENNVTLPKRKFFLWHKKMSSYYRKALVWQKLFAGNTFVSSLRQKRVNFCLHFVWAWRFCGSLAPWILWNIPPCWQRGRGGQEDRCFQSCSLPSGHLWHPSC